jgi:hypothetical protein
MTAARSAAHPADRSQPHVSVLIACWNAEDSIERALHSVLDEPGLSVECVVVDDASTDRTSEVVAAVAERDGRVVLVRQPENLGVSAARNRGLELTRGEWLTLLDADDRFVDGGLGRLVRAGDERGAQAVVGQQVWTDGRRRWLTELYDIPDVRTARRTSLAAAPGLVYFASPHAKLFRRPMVADLRFEGRVLGDQPWILRGLLRAGEALEVIDATVYEWWRPPKAERARATSITASSRSSARRGVEAAGVAIGALNAVLEEARRQVQDPGLRARLGATYVERLLRSDLAGHLAGALKRRDPGAAELLGGIERFIAAAPPDMVRDTDALARDILEPTLARIPLLDSRARSAAWSLAGTAATADPRLWRHGSDPLARLALRLATAGGARSRRRAGVAMLGLDALPRSIANWLRRGRRTLEAGRRQPG